MNILAIGAHPDDVESSCGGTLAKYAKLGHKVFTATATNGNVGSATLPMEEIAAIRKEVPECMFRVGELMFSDEYFDKPGNKRLLVHSVLTQMSQMGDPSRIFSECSVYPDDSLSPENLRRRIVLERRCGLENINLMCVERMNSPEYYQMLADNYEYFESIRPDITLENIDSVDFENID